MTRTHIVLYAFTVFGELSTCSAGSFATPLPAPAFYSVRDFGALGDIDPTDQAGFQHHADDSQAFQAAIHAFAPNGTRGGTIQVPFGVYRFANTFNIDRQCVIRGGGAGG